MYSKNDRQSGFSAVELLVAVAIIFVIAALAMPNLVATMNNYRLDASGHAVASILAQARLQAVRNNFATYAQYTTSQTPNLAYINNDPTVAYAVGNPDVEIASASFQNPGLLDHSQLDAYLSNGNSKKSVTAEIGAVIGFNARGLPCMETSAGNPALCWQNDPTFNTVPYFEWFMQGRNGGWEAVTVSPAGRIKAWRLVPGTGCGYAACWQ